MNSCTIIGLSDSPRQTLPTEALEEISRSAVFSGGVRHRGLVEHLLPSGSRWIDITPPLGDVFRQYDGEEHIVIFASGDPLFYGFAATVRRRLPQCRIRVFPTFSSLQTLAHRLCLPYGTMRTVSLTGRGWDALDEALIQGEPLIGCLTDHEKTPDAIRERMHSFGYDNYTLHVGERLGNPSERVCLHERGATYASPNCLICTMTRPRPRLFGLPDKEFALLDGREAMITKMPVRLATLAALQLGSSATLWDIGFCTGSVSIEARLSFPRVRVVAFERRPQCKAILERNARHFGAPGITAVMGDFLEADLSRLPRPDAVFIGGHGGQLPRVMSRISTVLQPGGRIVFNSVSDESRQSFLTSAAALGKQSSELHRIKADGHNTITILLAT
ncbi:MAG: precorrin-6y C5,15-methyltransferase (decarboxylating) subunit CbiE [Prevotellaceae bacterium]|nr:precorrin-6y C5,15-methyltransferase (decarboxylating) subunit CbiE [Prevotellaceae bacterium]